MIRDLLTLRLFVRAAETGTLSEAAEQSNLALAAASRRISTLEERCKVQLFRRARHGLTLTPAGSTLLEHARALLEQVRAIEGELADFAGGMRGTVRIQTNPSAITQFLPADLAAFAGSRPDLRLDLEENISADVVAAVAGGGADLGIVIGGTATGALMTLPYREDQLALLAPRGTFSAQQAETGIAFAEVQDRDFVGLVNATALTGLLLEQASRAERVLRLHMQVRSFDGVCRMVEAGFGLGVLPLIAARGFAASMNLDVLPLTDSWATRRMLLCFPPAANTGSPGQALARHLHACAGGEAV